MFAIIQAAEAVHPGAGVGFRKGIKHPEHRVYGAHFTSGSRITVIVQVLASTFKGLGLWLKVWHLLLGVRAKFEGMAGPFKLA